MFRMLCLLAALLAAGCAQPHVGQTMPDVALGEGEHGRLDQISVGDMQARATMVRAQTRTQGGVADNTFLDRGISTEAQVAIGVTSGIGAAVVNGVAGYAIMDRKAKAIERQPASQSNLAVNVRGGDNVAISESSAANDADAEVNVTTSGCDICM